MDFLESIDKNYQDYKQCQFQISAEIAAQKIRSMTSCNVNFSQPMGFQDFNQLKNISMTRFSRRFFPAFNTDSFSAHSYQDCKTITDISVSEESAVQVRSHPILKHLSVVSNLVEEYVLLGSGLLTMMTF